MVNRYLSKNLALIRLTVSKKTNFKDGRQRLYGLRHGYSMLPQGQAELKEIVKINSKTNQQTNK